MPQSLPQTSLTRRHRRSNCQRQVDWARHHTFIINQKGFFMARQPGTYAILNTSEGTVVCRLFEAEAPKTVANFTELAEGKREWTHPKTRTKSSAKLYDGTIFHRVIPDFMI